MRKSTHFLFSVALGFSFGMMLAACAAPEKQAEMQEPAIGGERDAHGCLPAAGQSWSAVKQQCVQPFNVANIRLEEKQGSATFGIDVILSDDRQRAEIFSVSLPENTILQAVKGGYASTDGKIRLLHDENGHWKLTKQAFSNRKTGSAWPVGRPPGFFMD